MDVTEQQKLPKVQSFPVLKESLSLKEPLSIESQLLINKSSAKMKEKATLNDNVVSLEQPKKASSSLDMTTSKKSVVLIWIKYKLFNVLWVDTVAQSFRVRFSLEATWEDPKLNVRYIRNIYYPPASIWLLFGTNFVLS